MTCQMIYILCIYSLWSFKSCRCDCVTKEGDNFSREFHNFTGQGSWQLMANMTVLANCTDFIICHTINSDVRIQWNGSLHLEIFNITIANFLNVHLIQLFDNFPHEICRSMEIYASPQNISCDQPIFTKGSVSVSCSVYLISVPMACQFHSPWLLFQDNVTYSSESVPPYYYQKVCTLTSRVAISDPGIYVLNMSVVCILSNSSIGCGIASTPSLAVDLPKADIIWCPNGTDIRNNLIQAGSLATCTCELTSAGYPPGHAMWYPPDNETLILNVSKNNAILHLIYNNVRGSNHEYTCRAFSELGVSEHESSFKPTFAYGPSEVHITVNPSFDNSDMCPGHTAELNVSCVVPRYDVHPDITMSILINNTVISATNSTDSINFQLTLRHQFNTSGNYVISCQAQNSLFENLKNVSDRLFTVREPPTLAPVILVNHTVEYNGTTNNIMNISSNEVVTLSCIVRGGFPSVNTTNMTCDDPAVIPEGHNQVTVRMKDGCDVVCSCIASHVTGCYKNNISSLRLVWLKIDNHVSPPKEDSSEDLIIGLAVGLPLAVILIALVLTCEIKRRMASSHPPKRTARPPGYDTTTLQHTIEHQQYASVVITGDKPVIEEYSSYHEPPVIDSGNIPNKKVARPDSKEEVLVEKVGSETRITLESKKGRWKYLRSKITKRSLRNKSRHENPSLSVSNHTTELMEL